MRPWWERSGKPAKEGKTPEGRKRSVYSRRRPPEPEPEWIELGELDQDGHGFIDYSCASGWVPLDQWLRDRCIW